jgi:copper chaperone NosL
MKLYLPLLLLVFTACNTDPKPIEYGTDQCSFCKMNIVDQQHASQYVTSKGKQFKFDAIECMVNDLNSKEDISLSHCLVADYGQPGKMIDVAHAHFLISEGIPSPMGENLSAFSSEEEVLAAKEEHTGVPFDWTALQNEFKK